MTELLPCAHCGEKLARVDSVARALDQEKGGRPVWEYHHASNDCLMSGKRWYFDSVIVSDDKFVSQWNTRTSPKSAREPDALDQLTKETEELGGFYSPYGKVHTDGSRSGGQPKSGAEMEEHQVREHLLDTPDPRSAPGTCKTCGGLGKIPATNITPHEAWKICLDCAAVKLSK